jgi:hypothetical protein
MAEALSVLKLSFYHLLRRSQSTIRTLSCCNHLVLDHLDHLRSEAFARWARAPRTAALEERPSQVWATTLRCA